jgi:hypothetical protein
MPPPGAWKVPGWMTALPASLFGTLPSDPVVFGAGGAPEFGAGDDCGGGVAEVTGFGCVFI